MQLKINTGMGRLGVEADIAVETAKQIQALPNLELTGAFTHFASAAERDPTLMHRQYALFQPLIQQISYAAKLPVQNFHCANSAAILRFPSMRLSCVRPGTILYGQFPSQMAAESGRHAAFNAARWLFREGAHYRLEKHKTRPNCRLRPRMESHARLAHCHDCHRLLRRPIARTEHAHRLVCRNQTRHANRHQTRLAMVWREGRREFSHCAIARRKGVSLLAASPCSNARLMSRTFHKRKSAMPFRLPCAAFAPARFCHAFMWRIDAFMQPKRPPMPLTATI